jgi:hypothetical protein
MAGHKKPHLPEKICKTCRRPFAWRKKWEKVWIRCCIVRTAAGRAKNLLAKPYVLTYKAFIPFM